MKTTKIIAALALCAIGSVSAQPLEFKGTPFGATFEQFTNGHPEFNCDLSVGSAENGVCTVGRSDAIRLRTPVTFAGKNASFMVAQFRRGVFAGLSVSMSSDSYDAIKAAVAEKYGVPKVSTETVSNRAGFSATNETSIWLLPDGRISVERYGSTLDEGHVWMTSAAEWKQQNDEIKAKISAGKSDL